MSNNHLKFDIVNATILDEPTDSQFATARIEAFNTGRSLHDTLCDEETLKRTASTIYEKPIIFEYDGMFGDFGSHPDERKPIISGFVVKDSADFITRPDGRTTLSVTAKIWKKYSGKFLEVFKNTGKDKKKVSVEMEISRSQPENGLLKLLDFAYTAICVLGDTITEASPGANLQMLSFSKEENDEYEKAYNAEFSIGKYSNLDFSIPKDVKSNAKDGLSMADGVGVGTAIVRSIAKHLIKNSTTTPERILQIIKQFSILEKKDGQNKESFKMLGGKPGKKWAEEIASLMKGEDDKRSSYFSVKTTDEKEGDKKMDKDKEIIDAEKPVEEGTLESQNFEAPPEKPEEDKPAEEPAEKPEGEKKFSLADFIDVVGARGYLEEEGESDTDDFKYCMKMGADELDKEEANFGLVLKAMYSKMCKMAESLKEEKAKSEVYMAENEELKKFKVDRENEEKKFAVEDTLRILSEKVEITDDVLAEMRTESEKFSLQELEGWKNYCKAKSFDFAVKNKPDVADSKIVRIGLPFTETTNIKKDIWATN